MKYITLRKRQTAVFLKSLLYHSIFVLECKYFFPFSSWCLLCRIYPVAFKIGLFGDSKNSRQFLIYLVLAKNPACSIIIHGCAAGAITCRGFDKVRFYPQGNLAEMPFFIIRQVTIFKNHFHCDILFPAYGYDPFHLFYMVPISAFQLHQIDHMIHFTGALFHNIPGFKYSIPPPGCNLSPDVPRSCANRYSAMFICLSPKSSARVR